MKMKKYSPFLTDSVVNMLVMMSAMAVATMVMMVIYDMGMSTAADKPPPDRLCI